MNSVTLSCREGCGIGFPDDEIFADEREVTAAARQPRQHIKTCGVRRIIDEMHPAWSALCRRRNHRFGGDLLRGFRGNGVDNFPLGRAFIVARATLLQRRGHEVLQQGQFDL